MECPGSSGKQCNPTFKCQASLMAQTVKNLPVRMQETQVPSLGREDPLKKVMATHSSILARRIPWTEEPGGLQSMGSQKSDTTERLSLLLNGQSCENTSFQSNHFIGLGSLLDLRISCCSLLNQMSCQGMLASEIVGRQHVSRCELFSFLWTRPVRILILSVTGEQPNGFPPHRMEFLESCVSGSIELGTSFFPPPSPCRAKFLDRRYLCTWCQGF